MIEDGRQHRQDRRPRREPPHSQEARALPALGRGTTLGELAVVTAAGAAVAWLLGILPSTFHGTLSGWPPVALAVAGLVAGAALLTTIGGAQWLVALAGILGGLGMA